MKYNRFFNRDIFSTLPGSEMTFVYSRVSLKQDGKIIYPFYLVIKPFQIEFNYYGPKFTTPQKGELERFELKHRELFTLTLSDDYSVNKILEKELKDIYDNSIDLSRFNPENELRTKPDYRLEVINDDLYRSKKEYDNEQVSIEPLLSYNSISPNNRPEDFQPRETSGIIAYRTIFLDFLFDFIETKKPYSDFAYNPYFDEVEQRLMSNHFFFSLCMMYSYKYRRIKLIKEIESSGIKKSQINEKIKKIKKIAVVQSLKSSVVKITGDSQGLYLSQESEIKFLFEEYNVPDLSESFLSFWKKNLYRDDKKQLFDEFLRQELIYHADTDIRNGLQLASELQKAEHNWLKALSHQQADETIEPDNKWFAHIEKERSVIFGIQKYESTIIGERFLNLFRNIFHFTLRKKDKYIESRKLIELNSYAHLNYEAFYKDENDKLDISARWFLDRHNISGAFKLFSVTLTILLKVFVSAVLIVSFMELITAFNKNFQPRFNVFLIWANIISVALFTLILIVIILKSGLLFLASLVDKRYNTRFWYNILLRIKYRQNRVSGRVIGFLMPKLMMAIFSGWIILLTAEEIWKSIFDVYIGNAALISFILLFILFLYVMLEIQKIKPKISVAQIFTRTAFLIAFGIFYSNLIGITTISLSSERMLTRSGFLESYFHGVMENQDDKAHTFLSQEDINSLKQIMATQDSIPYAKDAKLHQFIDNIYTNKGKNNNRLSFLTDSFINKFLFIRIFPGMLLINTVIALFIGIFLQMLFDRRNIAEPI